MPASKYTYCCSCWLLAASADFWLLLLLMLLYAGVADVAAASK